MIPGDVIGGAEGEKKTDNSNKSFDDGIHPVLHHQVCEYKGERE